MCIASFLVAFSSPVNYHESDPKGSLLVSQAILEYGSIKLDPYRDVLSAYSDRIVEFNHHLYYYFPPGTSLLSIPFVWLANLFGWDMSDLDAIDQARLQNLISALLVAISCLLVFLISRCFVSHSDSLLITTAFIFGSSMMSTMGSALWSHDFTTAIILLVVLVLISARQNKIRSLHPVVLGALLFLAYLSRPTSAIFIALVLVYVFLESRKDFIQLMITLTIAGGFFMLLSWYEYGQLLPPYYLPSRLQNLVFLRALYGNLFSPARGLLVYSPFLLVTFIGLARIGGALRKEVFFWLGLSWLILHLIMISQFPKWWGGYSFGSRLVTEALPAGLLLTVIAFNRAHDVSYKIPSHILRLSFVALTLLAIGINTVQGMYSPSTIRWNEVVEVDENPSYVFDWRFAQFMANPGMLASIPYDRALSAPKPYQLGDEILPGSKKAVFVDWHKPAVEGGCRWSSSGSAQVLLKMKSDQVAAGSSFTLEMVMGETGDQSLSVEVNDIEVGEIPAGSGSNYSTHVFPLSREILAFEVAGSPEFLPVVINFIPHTTPNLPKKSPGVSSLCRLKIYPNLQDIP